MTIMTILESPTIEPATIIEDLPLDTDFSEKRYRSFIGFTTGVVNVVLEDGRTVNVKAVEGGVLPVARIRQVNSAGSQGVIQGLK